MVAIALASAPAHRAGLGVRTVADRSAGALEPAERPRRRRADTGDGSARASRTRGGQRTRAHTCSAARAAAARASSPQALGLALHRLMGHREARARAPEARTLATRR